MELFKSKLSTELLKSVLIIYFLITFLITIIHVVVEYQYTKDNIHNELVATATTFEEALKTALWDMNKKQLDSISRGISKIPLIYGFIAYDQDKKVIMKYARDNFKYEKLKNNNLAYTFSIKHKFNSNMIYLADVTIFSDEAVIYDRLKVGFTMLILNAFIKSTVLVLLFILSFNKHLSKSLTQLTDAISSVNWRERKNRRINIRFKTNNELTLLQSKFNELLYNISQEEDKQIRYEKAISENLELAVRQRTKELEDAKKELEKIASIDELTNIFNRRVFFEIAHKYYTLALRAKQPITFMMLDIDFFKLVNDTYGHQAGDELLKEFSINIKNTIRESDVFGRIGGEEFGIVLKNISIKNALVMAQKIKFNIENMDFMYSGEYIKITTSIGITQNIESDTNIQDLYKRADKALYTAKENGRNKIETI